MNRDFWKGRRVLLTGHTGFKGGWLALWLERLGAEVVGYALEPPTEPSLFEAADIGSDMTSIEADVRDAERLRAALEEHRPEIVLHLAAQALIQRSYVEPVLTYSTNVQGTVNVLEAVRHCSTVRAVIVITSDKCYENVEWVWGYRENDRLGGHDPYSASKAAAEVVVTGYRSAFFPPGDHARHGVALASARAGNVIGGGDWAAQRLVPDLFKAVMAGEPVKIRRPGAIRPWQFVLEPLSGYLILAERLWDEPDLAQGWNFGPDVGDARTVAWIADYVTRAWGEGATWERDAAEHHREDHFLKLDCAKAKSLLDWHPALRLAEALDWTVEWFRGYRDGRDMKSLTASQIARYEELRGW